VQALHSIVEWTTFAIDGVASLIMVWGFVVAVFAFLQISFRVAGAERIQRLQLVRCDFGVKLVFALELMIVSDVLHSAVSRSLEDLYFLGAIVLLRTVLGFFLNREIQEVRAEMAS